MDKFAFPEVEAGGFTRLDGTVAFYTRVNALLGPESTVLDFGAGRGATHESESAFKKALVMLRGRAKEVIGLDLDPAVRDNPGIDRALIYDGQIFPLPDDSVDLIVSDFTFEHIGEPEAVCAELERVLKPGGWLCARTPYAYSLVALAAKLIPNAAHVSMLKAVQPTRRTFDVFPTRYKLNTMSALTRFFPKSRWLHCSYIWTSEPSYHFGSKIVYRLMQLVQTVQRPLGGDAMFVFLRKL